MSQIIDEAKSLLDSMGVEYLELEPEQPRFADGVQFSHSGCTVEIMDGGERPLIAVKDSDDDDMSWEWVSIDQYREVIANPSDFV